MKTPSSKDLTLDDRSVLATPSAGEELFNKLEEDINTAIEDKERLKESLQVLTNRLLELSERTESQER